MRIPFLGGIGVPELIIILIVVLLIFGPKNLPKLGNAIGKTFKSLRDGMDGKGKKKDESAKAASDDAPEVVVEDAEPEKAEAKDAAELDDAAPQEAVPADDAEKAKTE